MSTGERVPLAQAQELAKEIVALLADVCTRITVAGSIRRKQETVGDIEIVCIPHLHQEEEPSLELWSARMVEVNDLDERCADLIAQGTFSARLDVNGRKALGSRYKRLGYNGVGLDLFAVLEPAQWGVIVAIRTGSAAFSKRLVTTRRPGFPDALQPGYLPPGFRVQDGQLRGGDGRLIPTPTEEDFFRAIGLDFIAPEDRH